MGLVLTLVLFLLHLYGNYIEKTQVLANILALVAVPRREMIV